MAIESGERNREVMQLIGNWCRHARVEKRGGVGLIEAQTGLPIGHHTMACDHAAARGIGTWDLADAAIDFYDRNCVGCTLRTPVGLPNITKLVGERDATRARRAAEQEASERTQAAQRAARQEERAAIRTRLAPLPAAIIDLVDELDSQRSPETATKLLATAQLASDSFDPPVIEYFFRLLEQRERWFDDTGLKVLQELKVDATRLTRCAMRALRDSWSNHSAFQIVELNAALADSSHVADALPALIEYANPRHYPMQTQWVSRPGPLFALHRTHSEAVEKALDGLLARTEPHFVSVGARGIESLSDLDRGLPSRLARNLIAKLARTRHLLEEEESTDDRHDGVINHLQRALAIAFQYNPDQIDALAMEFMWGLSGEDETRIYRVYELVLRGRRRGSEQIQPDAADQVALRRLLNVATQSTSYDVLQDLQSAFMYVAEELVPLARQELSNILGATLMLSDRIEALGRPQVVESNAVSEIERGSIRDQLTNLQRALLDWAAAAARDDLPSTTAYLEVLGKVRDEHEVLRAELVKRVHTLMSGPAGLNAVLPTLYGALFGPVVRIRAAAAAAIGKLDSRCQDDLPTLVYEALIAQLSDTFMLVHQTALETLAKLDLPEGLTCEAEQAVTRLLGTYWKNRKEDRFLLECICLYADRYMKGQNTTADQVSHILLTMASKIEPDVVAEELRRLRRHFAQRPLFAEIVLRVLEESRAMSYREDELLQVLNDLPAQEVFRQRVRLVSLGCRSRASHNLPRKLLETLTRVGAWQEAVQLTERLNEQIPPTVEIHPRKLAANRYRIAARYEAAIASRQWELLKGLGEEWKDNEAEIKADQIAHERRRRPFPDIPSAH